MKPILHVTSVVAALAVSHLYAETFTFTTLAGRAGAGFVDGLPGAARFVSPAGMALDGRGNIYVADTFNHTVRKIATNGVVSTLAGMPGVLGSANGAGRSARFNGLNDVAVDGSGFLYVADFGNHTIRKITPAGIVSTLAGLAGVPGSTDGPGGAARFNGPTGVALDSSNNVYVADTFNQTVRKITPSGVVSTFAGTAGVVGSADGTGAAAQFNGPYGVAVDATNNLYVTESMNCTIRKITPARVVSTFAGTAGVMGSKDGTGAAAQFYAPLDITVSSSGNIYVADGYNNTIRRITPARVVSTWAGMAGYPGDKDGTAGNARFNLPFGVAADNAGNVYVGDYQNCTVRKISPARVVSTFAGRSRGAEPVDGTGSAASFSGPNSVAIDTLGNVFVADETGNTIRKVTPAGVVSTFAGLAGYSGSQDGIGSAARFNRPEGVGVDSANNIYVADQSNHTIRKITPGGVVSTFAGLAGVPGSTDGIRSAARFNNPSSVAADAGGNVYVADYMNNTIRKITSTGEVSTLAGLAGAPGSQDGTGAAARFDAPYGVAVDTSASVYVAEVNNSTIRKITPDGEVSTLAGLAKVVGSTDGVGSAARFNGPNAVAVDNSDNVYVADSSNYSIRKITPDAQVSTIGGVAVSSGSADGTGSAARFNFPYGIAVDSAGNLYVADFGNNTVRKATPTSLLPPTVLQSPVLSAGQCGFGITGSPGLMVNLETSSNLSSWQTVGSYTLEGSTNWFLGGAEGEGNQFYRAVSR
jgi:sugar lactone lactonase YvrE